MKNYKSELIKIIKKYKYIFLVSIILIASIIFLINYISYNKENKQENEEPKIKENLNSGVLEDKYVGDFAFTNISCYYDGKESTLKYLLSNISETTEQAIGEYKIIIYDEKENQLTTIEPNITNIINPGEYIEVENKISIDLSKAYSIKIEI